MMRRTTFFDSREAVGKIVGAGHVPAKRLPFPGKTLAGSHSCCPYNLFARSFKRRARKDFFLTQRPRRPQSRKNLLCGLRGLCVKKILTSSAFIAAAATTQVIEANSATNISTCI